MLAINSHLKPYSELLPGEIFFIRKERGPALLCIRATCPKFDAFQNTSIILSSNSANTPPFGLYFGDRLMSALVLPLPYLGTRVQLSGENIMGNEVWSPPVGSLVYSAADIKISVKAPNSFDQDEHWSISVATGLLGPIEGREWLAFTNWSLAPSDPLLPPILTFGADVADQQSSAN